MNKRVVAIIFLLIGLWLLSLSLCSHWLSLWIYKSDRTHSDLKLAMNINNIAMFFGYLSILLSIYLFLFKRKIVQCSAIFLASLYLLFNAIYSYWLAGDIKYRSETDIGWQQAAIWGNELLFLASISIITTIILLIKIVKANRKKS